MFLLKKKKRGSFLTRLRRKLLRYGIVILALWGTYSYAWGRHLYLVTAYCNCPICINVESHRDGHFASGKPVYWGGAAADVKIPFRSNLELIPHWPQDWLSVLTLLKGRRAFVVEDRGGKIKGRHIDLFIPDSLGGHEMAKKWGVRRMRIKVNEEWAK